jgi:hypothetical protein
MTRISALHVVAGLALGASVFAVTDTAEAVGTRTFDLSSIDDLSAGDLTGVAVDSRGNVRPGWSLGKTVVNDAQTAWSSVLLSDGSALIGTGNEGKIIRVNGATVEVAATTGQMAVSSMAVAWGGDVVAGSFPNGKLYRLPKGQGKAVAAKEFGTKIEGVEYIWQLAFDEKSKSLYAATGPEGKVLRIDEQGKAQVHFDADDPHVVSLAIGPDGKVYCGTSGKAILYRIDAPGRGVVVNDFDAEDVSGIAVYKDGTVWATANKYGGSWSLPGKGASGMPGPSAARPGRAGEGVLFRFQKGVAEEFMDSKKYHFTSLVLTDDGTPYVGAGAEGRVLTVNADHLERIVADTEEREVASIVMSGKKRYIVSSDPVVFHEIKGEGGQDAVWTSKVMDAGLPADFGMVQWRSTGSVEVETRSGNTQEPDASWSAWSKPLTAPAKAGSPKGRYVQVRTRFAKDPQATFGELRLHFVTDNVRAVITSLNAEGRAQRSGKLQQGLLASGGKVTKGSTNVAIKWDIDNPDKDDLRYRIFYRLDGQKEWRDALKPNEVFTRSDFEWDTTSLPEGLYRVRVEASDELVNPPEKSTKHALESGIVVVDNTAPVFKNVGINGRRLNGEVSDGLGPISRIEVALAGSDDWRPVFPSDGIFDEATEKFDADIAALVPAGSRIVGVRAWDVAGNSVSKELEAK